MIPAVWFILILFFFLHTAIPETQFRRAREFCFTVVSFKYMQNYLGCLAILQCCGAVSAPQTLSVWIGGKRWRSKKGSCRFCFCSVCHETWEGFLHNYVMGTLPHHNISLLFCKFPSRITEMAPGVTIPTNKSPNACRCIWSYSWIK